LRQRVEVLIQRAYSWIGRESEGAIIMSSVLEIQPDVAAEITTQARAKGISVDDYLRTLLRHEEVKSSPTSSMTPTEKARALREWAASHNPNTPLLSDEAISRESIYGERG
jgi:hypothetical protein